MTFSLKSNIYHSGGFNKPTMLTVFLKTSKWHNQLKALKLVFCKTKYNAFPGVYPCNSIIDMLLENCSMKITISIL